MSTCRALDRAELDRFPLPAVEAGDKDSHGRLLIISGSLETPGSGILGANAALRAGAGKVAIATAEPVASHMAMQVPEAKVIAVKTAGDGSFVRTALDELVERASDYDAVVAGPGMKRGSYCRELAAGFLATGMRPLVLDAAMLYELSQLQRECREAAPILLPHDREMASLIDCQPDEANAKPLECGLKCAASYGTLTLVKGPQSHIVSRDGQAWKYSGGGPGLGVSGSGDVLAGILGGLLARGAEPLNALLWAVWLHGEAGAALAKKVGPIGFLAREIADEVPALLPR